MWRPQWLRNYRSPVISISNDPHFSGTTLGQAQATLDQAQAVITGTKRRKIRVKIDPTTIGPSRVNEQHKASVPPIPSLEEFMAEVCSTQPTMLNYCYKSLFATKLTSQVPRSCFPRFQERRTSSRFSDFLNDLDEIEQGRDIQSRRASLSLGERLSWGINPDDLAQDLIEPDNVDFRLDPLSPMEELLFEEEADKAQIDFVRRLGEFQDFLRSRARHLIETKPQDVQLWSNAYIPHKAFPFEALIPSRISASEATVSRKLAANSFATILELSTRGFLELDSRPCAHECSIHLPDSIYVILQNQE